MPAVQQADELNQIQLSAESQRCRISEPATGSLPCTMGGDPILPARHAQQLRHPRRPTFMEHPKRHRAPKRPAPEVPLRQALRKDVVEDDEIRDKETARPGCEQAFIHFCVFAREKSFRRAANIGRVRSAALQNSATDYGVAAGEEKVGRLRTKCPYRITAFRPANYAAVVGWDPIRRRRGPLGNIRTADEINVWFLEPIVHNCKPSRMDFFVIIDESYQLAIGGRDSCIQGVRPPLPRFPKIPYPRRELAHRPAHHFRGTIARVIVNYQNFYFEVRRCRGVRDASQGPAEQGFPVVCWDNDVELHRGAFSLRIRLPSTTCPQVNAIIHNASKHCFRRPASAARTARSPSEATCLIAYRGIPNRNGGSGCSYASWRYVPLP